MQVQKFYRRCEVFEGTDSSQWCRMQQTGTVELRHHHCQGQIICMWLVELITFGTLKSLYDD